MLPSQSGRFQETAWYRLICWRKRTARAYLNNFLNDDDDDGDEGANKIGQAVEVDKPKVVPPQAVPSKPRTANAYLDALLEDEDEPVPPPTVARGSSVAVSGFIDADAHQPQAEVQPSPLVEPEADTNVEARSTRKRPYSNVEEDGDIGNMAPKKPMKRPRRIQSIIPEREIDVVGQVKAIREKRKKAEDALMPSLPRGIVDATKEFNGSS